MSDVHDHELWNGERGTGGISWEERSRMGPLRGVLDAADAIGRRNRYLQMLHELVLRSELRRVGKVRRALDFGCGTGRFLSLLASSCEYAYGIDREPTMVEAAKYYAGRASAGIVEWNGGNIPFADEFFDLALCSSVLSVSPPRLVRSSLDEIARVCRDDATLIVLDKIYQDRRWTQQRYRSVLATSGFLLVRCYPFRTATSTIVAAITRTRSIPLRAFQMLARFELWLNRRRERPAARPYVEYAFVARKYPKTG
jgi:ubiquinone/menaquinone biosynthesis C-methylase UbiE